MKPVSEHNHRYQLTSRGRSSGTLGCSGGSYRTLSRLVAQAAAIIRYHPFSAILIDL